MKKSVTIRCCKAGRYEVCKGCRHSVPHVCDTVEFRCSEWGDCLAGLEYGKNSVRCVRVKEDRETTATETGVSPDEGLEE